MPLLDHFNTPLSDRRDPRSFLVVLSTGIADRLNRVLPEPYFAEAIPQFDRPTVDVLGDDVRETPMPVAMIPILFPDSVEVLVYSTDAGPTLVAAVELVSPGNKDRPDARRAFVAKCATYLHSGVGLMVIDIVTNRQANLHNDLMAFLGHGSVAPLPEAGLFATAYRPARNPRQSPAPTDRVELWAEPFAVGGTLPRLHLPLDRGQLVPVDLEATYTEARQRSRLG